MDWITLKTDFAAWTGLDRDALHVYAGLCGSIGAAAILRRSLASPLPWLLVLLAELGNEASDMLYDGVVEQWELDGARHDLWNTMVAPTILLILARFAPGVMSPRRQEDASETVGQVRLEDTAPSTRREDDAAKSLAAQEPFE